MRLLVHPVTRFLEDDMEKTFEIDSKTVAMICLCTILGAISTTRHDSLKAAPLVHPSASQEWGTASEGVQLSARARQPLYEVGQIILVNLVARYTTNQYQLKNFKWDKPVTGLTDSGPSERQFEITVTNSEGVPVPLTLYGKNLASLPPISGGFKNRLIFLQPGEELEYHFWINRIYDMTVPNTYLVTFKRKVPTLDGRGTSEVISNIVSLKVIEPNIANTKPEDNLQVPVVRRNQP